jgi:hypothetical protein
MPGFAPRSVHVGFVLGKAVLRQVSLRVVRFSSVNIIQPLFILTHVLPRVWTTNPLVAAIPHTLTIVTTLTITRFSPNIRVIIRSLAEARDFSSNLSVQTGSRAHPTSCPMCTEGPFPGGKAWPGRDADHSPLSSAEVKND